MPDSTIQLNKKALYLSYFTVGYNVVEGIIAISAGTLAGSSALMGFGLDSFVESLSGSVMIWRFRKNSPLTEEAKERLEQKALRLIGVTFIILGCYVAYEAVRTLYSQTAPESSPTGIILTILSLLIMPTLFYLKRRTAQQLGSKSLKADSKQTLFCIALSGAVLLGLAANTFFDIWQLDPIIGLIIAVALFKEGHEAWSGEDDD
jgi:divalent metal cation (Fe/Co/Zn/Cd) transporter